MKLSIVFLAILGLAVAAPANEVLSRKARSLSDDLNDFVALVDIDAVLGTFIEYLADDEEVQAVIVYIQTEEFHNVVNTVVVLPEYIAFLDYLEDAGLAVYDTVNLIHSILGIPEISSSRSLNKRSVSRMTGGVAGLIADLKAILPIDEIKALYNEKLETSPDFVALIDTLASDDFQKIVLAVQANEDYQTLLSKLSAYGLNVDEILSFFRTLIGVA